ncbi:SDR family oxidoreductase [Nocardiopsis sp. HNM0947]|uniref:SDR family oxidoreductase n=1 Tax=Nocardiopsis coralli TaxID=2772213 RepID=A0ABR9PA85_9ACTN|nr:SDR family oxidoreductase [Nocardiopsis coralli]MBE3000741.1 SDR family oxidoreductase [Nocardiopsis coralli]
MGILDGRVVLVTGGARGIGESHVRHCVDEGAEVVFGDVLDTEGRALARELGAACHYVHHDVTNHDHWTAAVEEAVSRYGALHGLVNNAGVLRFRTIEDMTLDEFNHVWQVNVAGSWLGVKTAAGAIEGSGGGSIVNTSSIEGFVGAAGLSAYSAAKFAIRGLTKVAARELGSRGIRVNSLHPGAIATPMTTGVDTVDGVDSGGLFASMPISRWGQPIEVSRLASFLLSDKSAYCTGSEFVADGGMTTGPGY